MGKVIGIDLGTTNSVAAYMEGKNPEIILTPEGERLLPSLVAFSKTDDRLVGIAAKSQLITNIDTIYSVKRLIGKRYSEVAPYIHQFNYSIVEGQGDMLKIQINDKLFSPEEISAMILEKLKEAAEQRLMDTIDGVIITVPAYFNDAQRQATKDAGEIAGLNVLRIINEPTAASLAFSLDLKKKHNVLVYDFGGGTIDISVLDIQDDVIKVLATAGDINLGGNDFDMMITKLLVEEIKKEYGVDLSTNKMALQRIRDTAENTKKELSTLEECEINLPFIAENAIGPVHFLRYYSRKEFELLIKQKIDRTIEICSTALNKAGKRIDEIDEILLVGGSTRIPYVQKRIKDFFKKEPNKKINPDEIVAMGAAIQGAIATGETKDILLLDVIPLSLGVKTFGGTFTRVLDANTTIPTNRSLVFSTADDNQSEVEINVYQGEREIAEENKLLGQFTLTGIPEAPKGIPRIEVLFSIDINGILTVTAIDLSTKNKKEVIVSNSGLLSTKEIWAIKKNTETYKKSDLRKKELIALKTEIYNYVYSIKKMLENSQLEPEMISMTQNLLQAAHDTMEREIKAEMDEMLVELANLNVKLNTMISQPVKSSNLTQKQNETFGDPNVDVSKSKEPFSIFKEESTSISDATDNEIKEIKQKIIKSIYNIEQHLINLELDDRFFTECNILIKRANAELDMGKLPQLGKIYKVLSKLRKKLEVLANSSSEFPNKSAPENGNNSIKYNLEDTQPYKLFKE